MLRRFKLIKQQLQSMVISERWSTYRDDVVAKAKIVKDTLLDDLWWDRLDYIISFTEPIYEMLRSCDTDKPCLHLVYEMWDSMLTRVKASIYRHENKRDEEDSSFWSVVQKVLEDRWSKSNTPLHCLAHSLNPRCSTTQWQNEHPNLTPPQYDPEISKMRHICLKRLFPDEEARFQVNVELANFFGFLEMFADVDSLRNILIMEPKRWWLVYGTGAPLLQKVVVKLLGHVTSSSCCERNWSTYSFIHSSKRNQITPPRAQNLVYVHNNLRILSRKTKEYMQGESKMWDVSGDAFEADDVGILEVANLTFDDPEIESQLFMDEVEEVHRSGHDGLANMDD